MTFEVTNRSVYCGGVKFPLKRLHRPRKKEWGLQNKPIKNYIHVYARSHKTPRSCTLNTIIGQIDDF